MSELAISVVLAAYKGEKYIQAQLESIEKQLDAFDELIISVDPSDDQTFAIAKAFEKDRKIKMICLEGPGKGVVANFEHGLTYAQNPLILLCDQDDVWLENKVAVIRQAFMDNEKLMGLVHDCAICDEKLKIIEPSFFAFHHSQNGLVPNIIRNSFIGCCMAFRKEVLLASLPFPTLPMHDQFLGLQAMRLGEVCFLPQVLSLYRRHDNNVSDLKPASLYRQIQWRSQILLALSKRPIKRARSKVIKKEKQSDK